MERIGIRGAWLSAMAQKRVIAYGLVVLAFVAAGIVAFIVVHADTAMVDGEAEDGTIAGSAAAVADATASNGQAVKFGTQSGSTTGVWSSGATSGDLAAFASWRGRPLDNSGTWPNRETWDVIANPDVYGAVTALASYKQIWIGLAMLPEQDATANFAQCATGAYDQYYKTYGENLKKLNRDNAIIRLGWEANGDWFKWSIGSDIDNYKACFRKEVAAIKSTAPNVLIDWNMNKDSHLGGTLSVADAYPGDDMVDIVGVDFYDNWPAYPNQAAWDADYNVTQNGGPRGLGTWLEFAKAHNKKLSLPEWGMNTGTGGGADDTYFMQAMYNFFSSNYQNIAYETYFNLQDQSFMIYPAGINPQSSALYQQLWSASPKP
jgi:hypothetical protein